MRRIVIALFGMAALGGSVTLSAAQTPAAPPAAPPPAPIKIWKVDASAGLALTSGNSDTSTVNAAYDLVFDPHQQNVVKSDGLFLRGSTEGDLTANRLGLDVRDEYKLSGRLSAFGQNQYLRDTFKNISYLIAPTGGLSVAAIADKATQLEVSLGAGGVWEQDTALPTTSSGAVTFGEKLNQALTSTSTFGESVTALWKTSDFGDALYTGSVSLAASMSTRTQLKIEVLDTFKAKPPTAAIRKNDVAIVMAIVYKM